MGCNGGCGCGGNCGGGGNCGCGGSSALSTAELPMHGGDQSSRMEVPEALASTSVGSAPRVASTVPRFESDYPTEIPVPRSLVATQSGDRHEGTGSEQPSASPGGAAKSAWEPHWLLGAVGLDTIVGARGEAGLRSSFESGRVNFPGPLVADERGEADPACERGFCYVDGKRRWGYLKAPNLVCSDDTCVECRVCQKTVGGPPPPPLFPPSQVGSCCCVEDLSLKAGFPPGTTEEEVRERTPANRASGGRFAHSPYHWDVALSYQPGAGGVCTWEHWEFADFPARGLIFKQTPAGYDLWEQDAWNAGHQRTARGRLATKLFREAQAESKNSYADSDSPYLPAGWSLLIIVRIRSGCASCKSCWVAIRVDGRGRSPRVTRKGIHCKEKFALPKVADRHFVYDVAGGFPFSDPIPPDDVWAAIEGDDVVVVEGSDE